VIKLAYAAGEVALGYFGRVGASRKPDRSFVTEADNEIEKLVRRKLAVLTPGFGILGEEQGAERGAGGDEPYWVVDPLDGTSSFVSGLPCWAFSLGLVEREEAEFGLVYLPLLDELYYTGADNRVYRNAKPYQPAQPAVLDSEAVLYTPSDAHRRFLINFPGKVRSLGSAAYHGLLTARATTAGVLQSGIYLWDAAAILAINRAWGIQIASLEGKPVRISQWGKGCALEESILLSHPENFETVASTIKIL